MLESDGQNSCDHFEPVLHPVTKPSPSPPPRRGSSRYLPTHQISSAEWRNGAFEFRPETEEAHTGKPRRYQLFTEALQTVNSGGGGKTKKKNFWGDFSKKAENHFQKSGKYKKKSGIPPKSRRLTSLICTILKCIKNMVRYYTASTTEHSIPSHHHHSQCSCQGRRTA